jgi:2-polyprenyl-6-methoxyphenol hydroxylase-like FAD-dependent oxidoreductase
MKTTCCIAGGGPAGIMLGFLLARAGVDVTVLEKHADFLRDFRGDTVHPSTLELLRELGLLDEFLKLPHSEVSQFDFRIEGTELPGPSFVHLPATCNFVAFMPQWDFLNFLAERAKAFPTFHLMMQTEAAGLVRSGERVTGVRAIGPEGALEIDADLVVGCDGRHSTLRDAAGVKPLEFGSPIDVLWMRVPRLASDPGHLLATIAGGKAMILIDRGSYWQCAYVVRKNSISEVQALGLETFREDVLVLAPYLGARVDELKSWDDIKLLTVEIDRLAVWSQPGLLFIGDAAHAMSPMGGVGINLAIQDAVAAANVLWQPLLERRVSARDVAAIQARREMPVRRIQKIQVFLQDRLMSSLLGGGASRVAAVLRLTLTAFPFLRDYAGRIVGLGFRPERIASPASGAG